MTFLAKAAGLLGLVLVWLAVSCSRVDQNLSSRLADLEKRTVPDTATVTHRQGPTRDGWQVTASWEFDNSWTRDEYLRWVTLRLGQEFSRPDDFTFTRRRQGDRETLSFVISEKQVQVRFIAMPD
jgi:hypothetical protein